MICDLGAFEMISATSLSVRPTLQHSVRVGHDTPPSQATSAGSAWDFQVLPPSVVPRTVARTVSSPT